MLRAAMYLKRLNRFQHCAGKPPAFWDDELERQGAALLDKLLRSGLPLFQHDGLPAPVALHLAELANPKHPILLLKTAREMLRRYQTIRSLIPLDRMTPQGIELVAEIHRVPASVTASL